MTRTLNDIMRFDHVIRVTPDGAIEDGIPDVRSPELHVDTDTDGSILKEHEQGLIELAERQGWQLLRGWSGQWHYRGPLMHTSEFVGGRLEDHIRQTPGLYCAVDVDVDRNGPGGVDLGPAGWVVAFREQ